MVVGEKCRQLEPCVMFWKVAVVMSELHFHRTIPASFPFARLTRDDAFTAGQAGSFPPLQVTKELQTRRPVT